MNGNLSIAGARSLLFVPATRPERFSKAFAAGSDAIVVDLEDAVAPSDKHLARSQLVDGLAALDAQQRARTLVRINSVGTSWHAGDMSALPIWLHLGLGGVMVPKAESAASLSCVASQLPRTAHIVPIIESVKGLGAANRIACAPQVIRLAFGHLDFQLDARIPSQSHDSVLAPVRLALVLASRRADIAPPVDGITAQFSDSAFVHAEASRARAQGFGAKFCIHPAQVAATNAAFSPLPTELAWARRVLDACEQHAGSAFMFEGKMIDVPVLISAQRIVDQASAAQRT
jgi:citrate lyase subunit beta / citryl-CoA lyase